MKDRDIQKEESKNEYLRDKKLVDDIVNRLRQEDMNLINDNKRKKEIAKSYMMADTEEIQWPQRQRSEMELPEIPFQ